MLGIEPNLRWKTFAGMVIELARDLGVSMMVTLGSLLADVPHTRPSPVTGGATDPELIERLGLQRSRYEGPTGIVGVLHDACSSANVPSVSLWAAVPHYVSLAPSPRAALALCQRLGDILGTSIDTAELEEASERYSEQVTRRRRLRRGDCRLRRGARAARGRARRGGGPSVRRDARRRADALPARARARQRRRARVARATRPSKFRGPTWADPSSSLEPNVNAYGRRARA